ncbi:MAG TPA: hypothetical protein VJ654_12725 [Noviherbaspirillum sp.]|nr:hypothetical protein [Noviherbaspirillum sp.]
MHRDPKQEAYQRKQQQRMLNWVIDRLGLDQSHAPDCLDAEKALGSCLDTFFAAGACSADKPAYPREATPMHQAILDWHYYEGQLHNR